MRERVLETTLKFFQKNPQDRSAGSLSGFKHRARQYNDLIGARISSVSRSCHHDYFYHCRFDN